MFFRKKIIMFVRIEKTANNELFNSYIKDDLDKFKNLIASGSNVNCLLPCKLSQNGVISLLKKVIINDEGKSDERNKEFFDILIDSSVHLESVDSNVPLLWHALCEQKDTYYAKKILEKGYDVNNIISRVSEDYDLAHHDLAFNLMILGGEERIDLFFEQKPNINILNSYGETFLNFFFDYNRDIFDKYIYIMIDNGADLSLTNKDGICLLHCIVNSNYNLAYDLRLKYVKLNLENNVSPNIFNLYGETLLMTSSANGYTEIAEVLIKYGADVNKQDNHGETALMHAIKNCQYDLVGILSKNNADFATVDQDGQSAAHYLSAQICLLPDGDIKTKFIEYLMLHPNLLDVMDNCNKTPMDILEKQSYNDYLNIRTSLNNIVYDRQIE